MKFQNRNTHIAVGQCADCKDLIVSEGGGRCEICSCKSAFIDQERKTAKYVRFSEKTISIKQYCPPGCQQHEEK